MTPFLGWLSQLTKSNLQTAFGLGVDETLANPSGSDLTERRKLIPDMRQMKRGCDSPCFLRDCRRGWVFGLGLGDLFKEANFIEVGSA